MRTGLINALGEVGTMLTKFVVIAEGIDEATGEREIWTFTNPDSMAWEILGLLEYGKNVDIASRAARYVRSDPDE